MDLALKRQNPPSRLYGTAGFSCLVKLWRGSLLPLGCEAAPKSIASASHSSGSKLPRHNRSLA
ncbi:hypothetical protein C1X57_11580 [Pseudomonas sp. FW215-E1]|nr:hypothetical protein C1X57_11580 [Pseudomonas sp. FW215-E1]